MTIVRRKVRPTAQAAQVEIDTRALEIAQEAKTRIDGHEDLCAERFKNISADMSEVKKNQGQNHRDNQDWLRRIETALNDIRSTGAADAGRRDGVKLFGVTLKEFLILLFGALAFATTVYDHIKGTH